MKTCAKHLLLVLLFLGSLPAVAQDETMLTAPIMMPCGLILLTLLSDVVKSQN